MSSALAMVLAAGITVPSIGPEKVSGETERGLDMRGEWEGFVHTAEVVHRLVEIRVAHGKWKIIFLDGYVEEYTPRIVDEGGGKMSYRDEFAIYKYEGDSLIICLSLFGRHPTSFQVNDNQWVFVLHRVKPAK